MLQRTNQQGYTLIELLVSISISIILLGLGFASFRSFGATSELDTGVDVVRGALYESQNFALAPESTNSIEVTQYGVLFNTDEGNLSMVRLVGEDCSIANILEPHIQQFNLNNILNMTSAPELVCFEIGPEIKTSSVGDREIEIVHRRTLNTRTLFINNITGQITAQ